MWLIILSDQLLIEALVSHYLTKASISSWSERMISHTGTETRPRLLSSSGEFSAMGESLTEQRRVRDEGPLGCKLLLSRKKI